MTMSTTTATRTNTKQTRPDVSGPAIQLCQSCLTGAAALSAVWNSTANQRNMEVAAINLAAIGASSRDVR
jgi:hypothetical protein